MAAAVALHWFRRDLRLDDNPALRAALASGLPVACAFCLDPRLFKAADVAPARLRILLAGLEDLHGRLVARGGSLIIRVGVSQKEIAGLVRQLGAREVHACADDEPFALRRDADAARLIAEAGAELVLHDDLTVIPHRMIALPDGGSPKTYSSYARRVERVVGDPKALPAELALDGRLLASTEPFSLPDEAMLAISTAQRFPLPGGETHALERLRSWRDERADRYAAQRDNVWDPDATSLLSPAFKLGMLSPRRAAAVAARAGAAKWRSEILWRDWFKYVLAQHPDLAEHAVERRWDALEWPGTDAHFEAWTRGETGFGVVDAGMRQLAETGYLPNRVRMIAASFLVKHLHVDWRRGEQWFRAHLADGDLSSNAGSWQWVAGLGLDASPYFRVFNPLLQERKFDPDGVYVQRWAPDRPGPIIDLAVERDRTLSRYRAVAG